MLCCAAVPVAVCSVPSFRHCNGSPREGSIALLHAGKIDLPHTCSTEIKLKHGQNRIRNIKELKQSIFVTYHQELRLETINILNLVTITTPSILSTWSYFCLTWAKSRLLYLSMGLRSENRSFLSADESEGSWLQYKVKSLLKKNYKRVTLKMVQVFFLILCI